MTREELIKGLIYDVLRTGGYVSSGDACTASDEIYDAIWEHIKEDE